MQGILKIAGFLEILVRDSEPT